MYVCMYVYDVLCPGADPTSRTDPLDTLHAPYHRNKHPRECLPSYWYVHLYTHISSSLSLSSPLSASALIPASLFPPYLPTYPTVSRLGILYIDDTPQSLSTSWLTSFSQHYASLFTPSDKDLLHTLFTTHLPVMIDLVQHVLKLEMLLPNIPSPAMIQSLTSILEALLPPLLRLHTITVSKEVLIERAFFFASVWAFGSTITSSSGGHHQQRFSVAWLVRKTISSVLSYL